MLNVASTPPLAQVAKPDLIFAIFHQLAPLCQSAQWRKAPLCKCSVEKSTGALFSTIGLQFAAFYNVQYNTIECIVYSAQKWHCSAVTAGCATAARHYSRSPNPQSFDRLTFTLIDSSSQFCQRFWGKHSILHLESPCSSVRPWCFLPRQMCMHTHIIFVGVRYMLTPIRGVGHRAWTPRLSSWDEGLVYPKGVRDKVKRASN